LYALVLKYSINIFYLILWDSIITYMSFPWIHCYVFYTVQNRFFWGLLVVLLLKAFAYLCIFIREFEFNFIIEYLLRLCFLSRAVNSIYRCLTKLSDSRLLLFVFCLVPQRMNLIVQRDDDSLFATKKGHTWFSCAHSRNNLIRINLYVILIVGCTLNCYTLILII
jgi:hypothetical protein